MREAGRICATVIAEMHKHIVPGVTTKQLDEIAERIKTPGLQSAAEHLQVLLRIGEQVIAQIPIVAAAARIDIVIQQIFEVGVHHLVLVLKVAVKGGTTDFGLVHDHLHRDFLKIVLYDQTVKGLHNGRHSSV